MKDFLEKIKRNDTEPVDLYKLDLDEKSKKILFDFLEGEEIKISDLIRTLKSLKDLVGDKKLYLDNTGFESLIHLDLIVLAGKEDLERYKKRLQSMLRYRMKKAKKAKDKNEIERIKKEIELIEEKLKEIS